VTPARPVRADVVFAALVVATVVAVLLNSAAAHALLTARGAAAAAAIIAFAKARFVVSDFMELRGTRAQVIFDVWLLAAAAASAVLLLR
jgi:hypothetical protein